MIIGGIECCRTCRLPISPDGYCWTRGCLNYGFLQIEGINPTDDPTNPSYYQKGNFATFDFILEVCKELPGDEAACVDDVLKYVVRYKQKNGVEDLKKAKWYLERLIKILEEKNAK